MIITQTPFRMSFFGGGTDFPDFYKEMMGTDPMSGIYIRIIAIHQRTLPGFPHEIQKRSVIYRE